MMFKKGSFEIGGTIYPVAIKVWGSVWLLNLKMIWGLFFVRVVGSCVRAANEKHSNCGNWPLAVVASWLASDWNEPGLWLESIHLVLKTDCGGLWGKECFHLSFTCDPLQYDPQFGDAFWNSSKYNIVSYLLRIMTSWAIVCHVWYMPPMVRKVRASLFASVSLSSSPKPLSTPCFPKYFVQGFYWWLV